jgi:hypothetical protein
MWAVWHSVRVLTSHVAVHEGGHEQRDSSAEADARLVHLHKHDARGLSCDKGV